MKTFTTRPVSKSSETKYDQVETFSFIQKYYFGTHKNDTFKLNQFLGQGQNVDIEATIYGGGGVDRLDLSAYKQSDTYLFFDSATQSWSLSYTFQDRRWSVSFYSVENVAFANGVKLKLTAAQAVLYGTKRQDSLALSPDVATTVSIQAGAGNDVISISPRMTRDNGPLPVHTIDGGDGRDNLLFYGLPSAYSFELKNTQWLVRDFDGRAYVNFMNIETASFSDGTNIEFKPHGYVVRGGTFNLDIGGTEGDDTFVGTTRDDIFRASSGADIYDLRKGGHDIIYLNPSAYQQGTTKIAIYGFTGGDQLLDARTGQSLLGRLKPSQSGYFEGSFKLRNEKGIIDVNFLAAPPKG